MNQKDVFEKIGQYESFINDSLKVDLKEIEDALKVKHKNYKDWVELKNMVKYLKRFKALDIDTNYKIPIGAGVYVNGRITEYEKVVVDIGCGCFLEMDYEEADKYADIRIKVAEKEIQHFRDLAVNVKVHIKMVLLGINELQTSLNTNKKTRPPPSTPSPSSSSS